MTVTATDPDGMQGQQTFQVVVPNRPPLAQGTIPSQTVFIGESATVDLASYFSEPDGETLNYSAAATSPTVVSTSLTAGTLTVTAAAKGTTDVTVTATDPGGLTATQVFEVVVPNRGPVAMDTVPAQAFFVGDTAEVEMVAYFADPDGDALTLAAASSNGASVAASASGSVVSIVALAQGTAAITVTATDPEGLSAEQSFEVTVPNRAPVAVGAVPAQNVFVGDTTEVDMAAYFTDADADALTYTAASSNGAAVAASAAGSVVSLAALARGTAVITVTATDPGGLSAQQGFEVTVPNRAPVAADTVPAQDVFVGDTAEVDMTGYFTDPDGDALTYAVTSSNGASVAASASGSVVSIAALAQGTAAVTVTATDPEGLSAEQSFEVTIPNRAPVAVGAVPAQNVFVGDTTEVDMAGYFSDADGDALTYTAASSNGAAVAASAAGGVVSLAALARGTAVITVTATDPGGLSAQEAFEVVVPNRAPVATGTVPAQSMMVGDSARVGVASYFNDPDGDSLSFAAASSDSSSAAVRIAGPAVLITAVASGSATVTVTASDSGGLSAQQAFEVNTSDRPVPRITHIEPAVLVEGESATISGSGFSPSPEGNDVLVGGLPATVLSSAETRLSISVPQADCLPPREVVLRVSTSGGSDSVTVGSTPITGEDLNWDRFDWRHTSAGNGCIHLPGGARGGEYLIGVTSVSEDPSRLVPVTVTGTPGDASVLGASAGSRVALSKHAAPLISGPGRVRPPPSGVGGGLQDFRGDVEPIGPDWFAGHAETMARNEALIEELGRPDWSAKSSAEASARSSLAEGDTVTLNVYRHETVRAVVRLVTDHVVWLEDLANPAGTFTDADLTELDALYSDHAKPVHDDYFGSLSDVDGNGRILVLMTIEVNRLGYGGFVNFCDLYPKAQCAHSNEAEMFYGYVPDPDGSVGYPFSKDLVLKSYPSLLTHEVTHIVQGNAAVFGEAPRKSGWELEGGAVMSVNLVGHRLLGNASGQDLGHSEWRAGVDWYGNGFFQVFTFFSGSPQWADRIAGAPEECTWLTYNFDGNYGPCVHSLNYGVGALVLRFAMDRWGGQYPGGEKALLKRLTQSPLIGFANLADVSPGWSIESIIGEFYVTLWLEGTAGRDTPGMTSWNIHDIVSRFDAEQWLRPYSSTATTPSVSARVRAGSTLFFHWTPRGRLRPTSFNAEPAGEGPFFVWAIRAR